MGFFSKLTSGLSKTRDSFMSGVEGVIKAFTKIDDEFFEELEETLIMSDMGVAASSQIIEELRVKVKENKIQEKESVKEALIEIISEIVKGGDCTAEEMADVILIVGVNGVGKTTTIGKLAHMFRAKGKKVIIAAADTFRAAAIDQLEIWAKRAEVDIIKQEAGSDPGAVVFDAVNAAKARKADVLICDTAGRLHNKKNLMDELSKINKIIKSQYEEAKIKTYIVLDATTGQNSLQQAKIFNEACNLSGVILTKLDGTAKGGIIAAIKTELNIPVKYIGVGEGIDDLQPFDADGFVRAMFYGEEDGER